MKKLTVHKFVTPTLVIIIICLIYVSGVLFNSGGDPRAFILLGSRFSEGDVQGSEGYDGQFAYYIALDPAGAGPYLDVPAYRYQRILYPLAARWLAGGRAALIPWTLILVNVTAIGLGSWATEKLLRHYRVNRWYTLVYGLYGGHLVALRTDLNEPLAQALVQLAMWAWVKERRWGAVAAFSLAALAKETALVFLAAYLLYVLIKGTWQWVIGLGLAAVPFLGYQLFLFSWLGRFGLGSGGAGATSFGLLPLGGWLSIAQVSFGAFLIISLVVVPMAVWPGLAGLWLSLRRLAAGEVHPFILSLLLNSAVILFLPASTFREPAAMLRLTIGLVSAMLLYGALTKSWRVLNYSTLWLFTNVLLLKGAAG